MKNRRDWDERLSGLCHAKLSGLHLGRSALVFDPENAVFPMRCIFTNHPVESMTEMKLYENKTSSYGLFSVVTGRYRTCVLPVSLEWRNSQRNWSIILGRILILISILGIVGSVAIPILLNLESKRVGDTIAVGIGIFVVPLIVGIAIPYLDGFNGSATITNVQLLKDGRVVLRNVSDEFVTKLPEVEIGMLHGVFGIESVSNE